MKTPLYSLYGLYIFYNGLYNGLYSGLYIETVPRGMLIGFDAGNAHTPTVAYVSLGACCKALLAPHRVASPLMPPCFGMQAPLGHDAFLLETFLPPTKHTWARGCSEVPSATDDGPQALLDKQPSPRDLVRNSWCRHFSARP